MPFTTVTRLRARMHRFLRRLGEQPVCFFKVPGNAGDALIQAGTMSAFDRAQVRWEAVEPGDDVRGRTVIVGGGGNLTPYYGHVERALGSFLDSDASRIVVLPHTIRGQLPVLSRLREHDLVICRDRVGYNLVRRIISARVALDHDMAFHLDADTLLGDARLAKRSRAFVDQQLATHGWSLQQFGKVTAMTLTRIDGERAEFSPPTDIDISHCLIFGSVGDVSPVAAWSLLECVRHCQRIVTDRLHVAIAAGLLGVSTDLYPNIYDKNQSVFEYSLRRFRSVRFVDPLAGRT